MKYILTLVCLMVTQLNTAYAEQPFLTARCDSDYPEAMMFVQQQLHKRGYQISRIQHVDKGLQSRGYESLRYRVIFFGRPQEVALIKAKHSALIPFFPLNITVFEKEGYTGISVIDPMTIHKLYGQTILPEKFKEWSRDIHAIVQAFKSCDS